MATERQLTDFCRLCLLFTRKKTLLFPITSDLKLKFEELTQTTLPLDAPYPNTTCAECKDKVNNTYFFKHRLTSKQCELHQIIENKFQLPAYEKNQELPVEQEPVEEEWLEEHFEDDDPSQVIALEESDSDAEGLDVMDQLTDPGLIPIPSVKNMQNPTDKGAIVKLIEEIEQKNQMILDFTAPHLTFRTLNRKPAPSLHKPAPKKENFVFKITKLLMKPAASKVADYNRHRNVAYNRYYQCSQCSMSFLSPTARALHETTHEESSNDRVYLCSKIDCRKEFGSKHLLESHRRAHSGKPFWCDICPASYQESYQLKLHKKQEHNLRFRWSNKMKRELNRHKIHCSFPS